MSTYWDWSRQSGTYGLPLLHVTHAELQMAAQKCMEHTQFCMAGHEENGKLPEICEWPGQKTIRVYSLSPIFKCQWLAKL